MGIKLANAPVYFTVAQVRFNPVLNLDGYLPAIQDRMRAAHFPDFKRETFQRLVMSFGVAEGVEMPAPSLLPQARCSFGDISNTSVFLLENNALTFQTTAYETFPAFCKKFITGLAIVHEALHLDFTERLGLRYLNAVIPRAGETLGDYLITEVLGLANKFDGHALSHSMSENVTANASGEQMVARVVILDGRVGLPADLTSFAQNINPRFTQSEGRHAIIDADAFHERREIFDLSKLESKLYRLHDDFIRHSFEMITTPHAMSAWS